jgi:hypothetical protein
MRTARYCKQLAQQIDAALNAAEQASQEGIRLYPFLFGYLAGDCTEEQQAEFSARIARLYSAGEIQK